MINSTHEQAPVDVRALLRGETITTGELSLRAVGQDRLLLTYGGQSAIYTLDVLEAKLDRLAA